jgi:hypothetical protein
MMPSRWSKSNLLSILFSVEAKHCRAPAFSLMGAVEDITDLFASSIGSAFMSVGLFLPFVFSITCFTMAYIPTLLLAGNPAATLCSRSRLRKTQRGEPSEESALQPLLGNEEEEVTRGSNTHSPVGTRFIALVIKPWASFPFNKTVILCLSVFTFIVVAKMCENFLLVYVSQRYDCNIAQV